MATPTYYSGIDLHKHTSYITTVNQHGHIIKQQQLLNHRQAIKAYFATEPGQHRAVVESTTGWYWLRDLLDTQGICLKLAHAKYLKAISYAKVKTDKVDSETLAQLLRLDMIPEAHQISTELRDKRDVLRTRLRLVSRRTGCRNSVHRLLEKFNATDVLDLPALYQLQAHCHLDQVDLLTGQIKTLEKALHPSLVPNADVQRLLRIPGIGKTNAFTIYLEVDGIERFATDKQFFSYCRLVPGANNSGASRRHRSGNKDGNRYLKMAFSHGSAKAIQYYGEIRTFYRKKRRSKGEAQARTLVAKELARIVYQVLKKQENFNGRFKGVALSRVKAQQWPLLPSPPGITGA